MEHIGKIIRRTTRPNTPGANTSISSSTDTPVPAEPDCPVCNGAGFYHPRTSGKVDYARVVACSCTNQPDSQQKQAILLQNSNLGPLERMTFDNLAPRGRSGYTTSQKLFESAYQAAKVFAEKPSGWLILVGPSGSGKTHLAAAVAGEQVRRGQPVLYITAPDLMEHLRSGYSPASDIGHDGLLDEIRNVPLLVLDDLGVHASTAWSREKLDQLLSYRFNRELPTLITLLSSQEMDERLRTRINDPVLCQVLYLDMDKEHISDYQWGPGLELQKKMTFETFDWKRAKLSTEQKENLERAYRLAVDYASSPDGWLVWQGVTGAGKTHLASAIVNYLYQAGQPAMFIVVPEFIDHLRSAFSPDSRISYDRVFEKVKTAPFLVLDDFGEQTATPWAQEKLYQVINYRYNARLATVITTTRSLDELDSRIRSRLLDPKISILFALSVPDYRSDLTCRPAPKTGRRQTGRR